MTSDLLPYIPMDRRQALARGETLPERAQGAALFADISGFTPLADLLLHELGPRRGAEELAVTLNLVYEALISCLHGWGGSALAYAGDAVTTWFEGDDGRRAASCALAMQEAMRPIQHVTTPGGKTHTVYLKTAVAAGRARRMLVGDPGINHIEALGGALLERLGQAEKLASHGQVILAPCAAAALAGAADWQPLPAGADGQVHGLLHRLHHPPEPAPWPLVSPSGFRARQLRPWLLPPVYRRLRRGRGDFLAELRPTVALFVRFSGIEYDEDPAAGHKLDTYIRWVQSVAQRHEGTLIDLNIGDKGSYLYINFGAPLAHENDAERALDAALVLRAPPAELAFMPPPQIGINGGQMRAGAYGAAQRKTYGALGDAVNLAARLMMAATPGQILAGRQLLNPIASFYSWQHLQPRRVKGKAEPVELALVEAKAARRPAVLRRSDSLLPLLGRDEEVALLSVKMALALDGHGQLVSVVGEAGIGKSALIAEATEAAGEQGFALYAGECDSYGTNSRYFVWQPIWRALFALEDRQPDEALREHLAGKLGQVDEAFLDLVPLLREVLGLPLRHTALTAAMDGGMRKRTLETMLASCLAAFARQRPLLLVLEDCHWLDPLSYDLLVTCAAAVVDLPLVILLSSRQWELPHSGPEQLAALGHHTLLPLAPLSAATLTALAESRLRLPGESDPAPAELLARRLAQQADGNPFYLEELVSFVRDQAPSSVAIGRLESIELPASLRSLVLSRLDRLEDRQQTLLRVASVIGRVFPVSWLPHIYPELGNETRVLEELTDLSQQNVTAQDPDAEETTYFFRHAVTRSAIYDSLLYQARAALHERIGRFLERSFPQAILQNLELLAYHYEHSENLPKKRFYLRRAAEAAGSAYANDAAIAYYRRLLPLLTPEQQADVLLEIGHIEQRVGRWSSAADSYGEALALATETGDRGAIAWSLTAVGELHRRQGAFAVAISWLERAEEAFAVAGDAAGLAHVLHHAGLVDTQMGNFEPAWRRFRHSAELLRELDDRPGIALVHSHMAVLATYEGKYGEARALHLQALEIRRALDDRRTIANSQTFLGDTYLRQGKAEQALAHLREAASVHRAIGDRWTLAIALHYLGNAHLALGDLAAARASYQESLAITGALGDTWALASLLESIARLACRLDRAYEALQLLGAARGLRDAIGAPVPPSDRENLRAIRATAAALYTDEEAEDAQMAGKALALDELMSLAAGVLR